MIRRSLTVLVALTILATACGDDRGGDATTSTPTFAATTTAQAESTTGTSDTSGPAAGVDASGRVTVAATVLAFLFDTVVLWGEAALDGSSLAEGITTVYPIRVRGAAVEADPEGISMAIMATDDKSPASGDNPWLVAFAVVDESGTCKAGVVAGFPAPNTPTEVTIPAGTACSAANAVALLNYGD